MTAAHPPSSENLLLSVDGVTVDFDGFKALDAFSLTLRKGTLEVLIGPNGAGKSTLCDAVIGRVRPSSGRVIFKNEDITRLPEHAIVQRGICRKFQTPGVLPNHTVAENLLVAGRRDRRWWQAFGTGFSDREQAQADRLLASIGLEDRRDTPARDLAHGEKQWLEIGMVVATDADLILLDEPTAGMGPGETSQTAALIHTLVGRHTVMVIDHDMDFLEQLDGHVTVMHQGRFLRSGSVEEIRNDAQVSEVYLGRSKDDAAAQV